MIYRILKYIFTILSIVLISVNFYLAWFIYSTPTTQFTKSYQPLEGAKVTQETNFSDGDVTYGGENTNDLSSAEELEKFRNNTKQKLFLKSRLIIPDLKVNLQIFEGTSDRVLTYGAGTIKPGQDLNKFGNYAVAAHNFADWNFGRGMSALQPATNVNGITAYVSDDEYVYTYKLISKVVVPREDSMVYTEDDFPQVEFSDKIKSVTSDLKTEKVSELRQSDNSIKHLASPELVNYAKLLTLYTCEVDPPYYNTSFNRILVTGVQVDKAKLSEVGGLVKQMFVQETQDNPVPVNKENKGEINKNSDNSDNVAVQGNGVLQSNIANEFLNKQLRNDINYVYKLYYITLGGFAISVVATSIVKRKIKKIEN